MLVSPAAVVYVALRKRGFGRVESLFIALAIGLSVHDAHGPSEAESTADDLGVVADAVNYAKDRFTSIHINSLIYGTNK